MIEYKGYQAEVQYDYESEVFHGRVINLRDGITFEGQSVREMQADFRAAVDDYLALCAERGEEPEKPFSGRFVVRTEPETHRKVALASAIEGLSLNAWVGRYLLACASKVIEGSSRTSIAASSPLLIQARYSNALTVGSREIPTPTVPHQSAQQGRLNTFMKKGGAEWGTTRKPTTMIVAAGEVYDC